MMLRCSSDEPCDIPTPRTLRLLCSRLGSLLFVLVAAELQMTWAADPLDGLQRYVRELRDAQSQLDVGLVSEARRLLRATEKSLHSFEFHYLQGRARDIAVEGAAPDLIRVLTVADAEPRPGVLDEAGRRLVSICRDGKLRIYDLARPDAPPRSAAYPEGGAVWSGAFSGDGQRFFAGYENGCVVVWDAQSWQILERIPLDTDLPIRRLAASPSGESFVAEGEEELELWTLEPGKPKRVAGVGKRYRFGEGVAFSPKGDMLATGGKFEIVLCDAATGKVLKSLDHASYPIGLAFSPDGRRVASAPRGNLGELLAVFDVEQEDCLCNAGPFDGSITGIAFSPDGKRIAATGCGTAVQLIDAATGEIVFSFERTECSENPAFSRDGRLLGWSEPQGYVFIDLGEMPRSAR